MKDLIDRLKLVERFLDKITTSDDSYEQTVREAIDFLTLLDSLLEGLRKEK